MNWNIQYGDCELITYTLSDEKKEKFTIKLTCMQGLILLNYHSKDNKKSVADLSKSTGVTPKVIAKCLEQLLCGGIL